MVIPAKISHVVLVLTVCISSVLGTPLTSPLKRRKMSNCTGNTRFPPLSPENNNLDAAQLVQYNYLLNVTKETFGDLIVTENADGSLAGPFNELLYAPATAQPWVTLQLAVGALSNTSLEAEAAVLGVLSVTHATYGIYAHTILSEKAGFTSAQVTEMLAGKTPSTITARAAAVYKLAIQLAQTRGPLDTASFNAALSVLGHAGVNAAIQQTAAFMYASIMLNGGDVCAPSGV